MAEKRMFSKQVLWSDKFIDLPLPAQALYIQMSMYADDEGFVNCAGYLKRLTGCSDNDIEALCKNGFIITFESGIYAIAHWKINNNIRADRLKKTSFAEERDMLYVRADGLYILDPERAAEQRAQKDLEHCLTTNSSHTTDECQSYDGTDKISQEKISTDKDSSAEQSAERNTPDVSTYRKNLCDKFGTENVERYVERFRKWADMHGRQNIPLYPTIEKWMNEDNVVKNKFTNSSITDEMLEECLMLDYI